MAKKEKKKKEKAKPQKKKKKNKQTIKEERIANKKTKQNCQSEAND